MAKKATADESKAIMTASIGIELPPFDDELFNEVLASQKATSDVTRQPANSKKAKGPEGSKGSGKSKGAGDLSFDPATGAEIAWHVLKFVGEAGIAVAGAVVGELIYKIAQKRREKARKTVQVRFPDGTLYTLVVDNPQSMAELKRLIAEKGSA